MDIQKIREDFPILKETRDGKPIVYADSACMALKPKPVIKALNDYYLHYTACGGRSAHKFAKETTELYEEARERVAHFINTQRAEEVIWTRNTTEAANIVMRGINWKVGDHIIVDDVSHNSNIIPWMVLKKQHQLDLNYIAIPPEGTYDLNQLQEKISTETKLVAITHVSNVMGVSNDVKAITEIAHDYGAKVFVDAAQSFPHQPIDVQELGIEFMGASIHKACGPTGIGILYGKYSELEALHKWTVGGETVVNTTLEAGPEFAKPPECFEAGLQNYAAAIGAGAAIQYLEHVGMEHIHTYEQQLAEQLTTGLKDLSSYGLELLGPIKKDSALAAFYIKDLNAHDINIMLDEEYNIFLRSGKHCTHAWHNRLHIDGTIRPSWYFYNTKDEINFFLESLEEILKMLS